MHNPFNKVIKFQKKTTIACLTLFMHAFCHMRVENLLKGPAIDNPLPPPPMAIPLFITFPNHPYLTTFFWQYCPNEVPDKYKNKLR